MKVFKWIARVMLTLLVFISSIIIVSYINHHMQLSNEDEQLTAPGEIVEVNGHDMHVFSEGDGEETLVFMAGGGISSPMLDFASLYSLLEDEFHIVVVEKAGYGFSEITDEPRDMDTILSETREALSQANISGPYTLMPYSMSGIEALYWTQVYPEEVKAIIGLDMAVPAAYEDYDIPMPVVHAGAFAANIGIIRFIPTITENDATRFGTLTDDEKALYETIVYRRTSTKNMVEEVKQIKDNAKMVAAKETPDVPMLLFASNGENTGWDKATWVGFQQDFIVEEEHRSLIELDAAHSVHNIMYQQIADDTKQFIKATYP